MSSKGNTYIIIAVMVVIIGAVVLVYLDRPQRFNWNESYEPDGTQPYDLKLFRSVLEASVSKGLFTEVNNIQADSSIFDRRGTAFVYVASWIVLDSAMESRLLQYAEIGNTVLLSTTNEHRLLKKLFSDCTVGNVSPMRKIRSRYIRPSTQATDTTASIHYQYRDAEERYSWPYFDLSWCQQLNYEEAGHFKTVGKWYNNLLAIPYGEGKIVLHSTPLIFTNYHLKNESVLQHAEFILSHTGEGEILWYNPTELWEANTVSPYISESILRFVLSHPPLKWAWYLLLALALIYAITSVRRIQRPLPVLAPPPNQTLSHLDVVSRMYRKEGHHKHMIEVQYKLMLNHLRHKYRLPVSKIDDHFFAEASSKLKMEKSRLIEFFADLDRARHNSTLTDEDFIERYKRITEFYEKCP